MDEYRDSDGLIDLDKISGIKEMTGPNIYTFMYNGDKYYFKTSVVGSLYNELVAYEIANILGINSICYDIASYGGYVGVLSKNFVGNNKYIPMSFILKKVYGVYNNEANNLDDIWDALYIYFKDFEIVKNLMDEIVNLFLFDVIIGNSDRHNDNYGILISDNGIHIQAFDNMLMGDENAIYYNEYSMKVSYNLQILENDIPDNSIKDFLSISDSLYTDRFINMLTVLDDDVLNYVISNVERRTKSRINDNIKKSILSKLKSNKMLLKSLIKEVYSHSLEKIN